MRDMEDERFLINKLKAIRFAFIVQTIGVIAILIYEGVKNGVQAIIDNPLWIVLLITLIVYFYLYLKISKKADIYDDYDDEDEYED